MVMLFWQTNGNLIKLFIRSSGFCSYLCDDVRKGLIYKKNKEFEDDERFVGVVTNGASK